MSYPEGCRDGKNQYICRQCAPKQQQACSDNHRIEQAKIKAHGGKTNMEIHIEDLYRIQRNKFIQLEEEAEHV